MAKVHNNGAIRLIPERVMSKTRLIALIALLAAISNAMMPLSLPITMLGATARIHFIQIPILTAALGIGPFAGAMVGLIGAVSMVFSVVPPNPFIILYNGLLGLFAGLLYRIIRRRHHNLLLTQASAVLGAFVLQVPIIWSLNTAVVGIPPIVVQTILVLLLLEDSASTLITHPILYRINLLQSAKPATISGDTLKE
jgi:riboflavin transporter FmnP